MGDTATPETGTGTCFVMQPFDGDKYDKRYKDTFAPAIEETGLTPYRVDRDAGVSIPIDDIESGIRTARLCFAEITTDNPNVWFELGFAISAAKDAVLICSEERTSRFPFDVQHRNIIKYRCGAARLHRIAKEDNRTDHRVAQEERSPRINPVRTSPRDRRAFVS